MLFVGLCNTRCCPFAPGYLASGLALRSVAQVARRSFRRAGSVQQRPPHPRLALVSPKRLVDDHMTTSNIVGIPMKRCGESPCNFVLFFDHTFLHVDRKENNTPPCLEAEPGTDRRIIRSATAGRRRCTTPAGKGGTGKTQLPPGLRQWTSVWIWLWLSKPFWDPILGQVHHPF